MRLNDQVRERLREEIARKDYSQRDLAELLQWSQSKVAKLLNGRVELSLNDLEAFCTILTLRPTEAVRDKGLEFCREMTPTDFRLFQELGRNSRLRDALLILANIQPDAAVSPPGGARRPPHLRSQKTPAKAKL